MAECKEYSSILLLGHSLACIVLSNATRRAFAALSGCVRPWRLPRLHSPTSILQVAFGRDGPRGAVTAGGIELAGAGRWLGCSPQTRLRASVFASRSKCANARDDDGDSNLGCFRVRPLHCDVWNQPPSNFINLDLIRHNILPLLKYSPSLAALISAQHHHITLPFSLVFERHLRTFGYCTRLTVQLNIINYLHRLVSLDLEQYSYHATNIF